MGEKFNTIYICTSLAVAVGDNMLPLVEREFPFVHVSPSTAHRLLQKQLQQVSALTKSGTRQRTSAVKKMTEMERKQKALVQVIKKELDHTKRMVSETFYGRLSGIRMYCLMLGQAKCII